MYYILSSDNSRALGKLVNHTDVTFRISVAEQIQDVYPLSSQGCLTA